jgi:hypothetical protein
MENLMTQYAQLHDPQPMKDAIDTLNEMGVTFQRPTIHQLKIDDLSFYPGRGTIFRDGSPGAMTEKGLDALVFIIKGAKQKLHSTASVTDGPRPARADDPVPILGSRPPYGKRRFV